MISAHEASKIILSHRLPARTEIISLQDSLGKVLAEDIFADLDQPPFHRVAMDGIAIRKSQLSPGRHFKVVGIVSAGAAPESLPEGEVCFEIMTGAALPPGADFVVRYEDLKLADGFAEVIADITNLSANFHPQGSDYEKGAKVLSEGTTIKSTHTAILASVGRSKIEVYTNPLVAILSTGDELVDIEETPSSHQIRWSNGMCLMQELLSFGITNVSIHKVPDEEFVIREKMQALLDSSDILLLTGGVSAGKFDFVPKVLKDCGVREVFHKVAQRPGKPLWFGVKENSKVVFGLPGNPVSCLVNMRKYVVPFVLDKCTPSQKAVLGSDVKFNKNFTFYCPVKVFNEEGRLMAYPVGGNGSGDFFQLRDSDGFMELRPQDAPFTKGNIGDVYLWGEGK